MSNPVQYRYRYDGYEENLERFANLVAAAKCEELAAEAESNGNMVLAAQLRARQSL
jgi:hypothetical protein